MIIVQNGEKSFVLEHFITKTDRLLINLLTEQNLVTIVLKPSLRDKLLQEIGKGSEPLIAIYQLSGSSNDALKVPYEDIQRCRWHDDDLELNFWHIDRKTSKTSKDSTMFESTDTKMQFINALSAKFTNVRYCEAPASLWHTGANQIGWMIAVSFVFGTAAIAGLFSDKNPDAPMRGRGRGLYEILKLVGSLGMLGIGLGICAIIGIWWYISSRNPPREYNILRNS